MTKAKVESILPLLDNQEILLVNHIYKQEDNGQILVQCELSGQLDEDRFKNSLQILAERHEAFRISVQWENLSKKIQVVQQHADLPISFYDWRTKGDIETELASFVSQLRNTSLDLAKAPISEFHVIKLSDNKHKILWLCHHILFDGISSRNVLDQFSSIYQEIDSPSSLPQIPSWKQVLNQIQSADFQRQAKDFWKTELSEFNAPKIPQSKVGNSNDFETSNIIQSGNIKQALPKHQLTVNSFIQTAVLTILAKLVGQTEVAVGTVVSGRNLPLPNINEFVGLLANVLPVIAEVRPAQPFFELAKDVQLHHSKAREFESFSLQRIYEQRNWRGNSSIFDCLLIVENFENSEIENDHFSIQGFESNITSNYPITITVIPAHEWTVHLKTDSTVKKELHVWIENSFRDVCDLVSKNNAITVGELLETLPNYNNHAEVSSSNDKLDFSKQLAAAKTASNRNELNLTKIWQEILQIAPIETTDNFFELGGKSIQAVRMFAKIEEQLGIKLNPAILLQNPTIYSLAKTMSDGNEQQWKSLVPLKPNGNLPPLFCIHSAGAHVFMYNELSKHLHSDRPLYALQPVGLDGETTPHESIEEMAAYYLSEIFHVNDNQPIHLLGYCFSAAVVLEMQRQLKNHAQRGEIIIVDSNVFPWHLKENPIVPTVNRRVRFAKKLVKGQWGEVSRVLKYRLSEAKENLKTKIGTPEQKHLAELVSHMDRIFLDYNWEPTKLPIHLISSTEFAVREDKFHHIYGWNEMSAQQLPTKSSRQSIREFSKSLQLGCLQRQLNKSLTQILN